MSPLLPSDFWTRLALLDARCAIEVKRAVNETDGAHVVVAVASRRDNPARRVEVRGASLRVTLARLLAAASDSGLDE